MQSLLFVWCFFYGIVDREIFIRFVVASNRRVFVVQVERFFQNQRVVSEIIVI